jgi:hypothetical protein
MPTCQHAHAHVHVHAVHTSLTHRVAPHPNRCHQLVMSCCITPAHPSQRTGRTYHLRALSPVAASTLPPMCISLQRDIAAHVRACVKGLRGGAHGRGTRRGRATARVTSVRIWGLCVSRRRIHSNVTRRAMLCGRHSHARMCKEAALVHVYK